MNDQSEIIVETIRQTKKIYEQVSRLLETADSLMQEAHWNTDSSTAIYGSGAIYNPRLWVPSTVTRRYASEGHPGIRKILAVLLDDEEGCGGFDIPIVIGTTLIAQSKEDQVPKWETWDASWWYLKYTDRSINGQMQILIPEEVYREDKRGLAAVHVFAFPLMSIVDGDSLKQDVIGQLLCEP